MNKDIIVCNHTPNYLPYIGFFHKLSKADIFVMDDLARFSKEGLGHRNKIMTPQGPCWLTIPIPSTSEGEMIKDLTYIDSMHLRKNWKQKHWNSIQSAYGNAPYFKKYSERFKQLYLEEYGSLQDLTLSIIDHMLDVLEIKIGVKKSSELFLGKKTYLDLTDKIINEVILSCGNTYMSGQGGKNYMDKSRFGESGIRLYYQEFIHPVYHQKFSKNFIPNLSAIDLLFNEGPKSKEIVRFPEKYQQVTQYDHA